MNTPAKAIQKRKPAAKKITPENKISPVKAAVAVKPNLDIIKSELVVSSHELDISPLYGEYDYAIHPEEIKEELLKLRTQIFTSFKINIDNIILMGEYFNQAKALLQHGQFENWAKKEFVEGPAGISLGTVFNWMLVNTELKTNPEIRLAFEKMQLAVVYKLCSSNFDPDLKQQIAQQALEGSKITKDDVTTIKKLHAQVVAQELDISAEMQIALAINNIDYAILPKISKLSKKKQKELAVVINNNPSTDVRLAYDTLIRTDSESTVTPASYFVSDDSIIDVDVEASSTKKLKLQGAWFDTIQEIEYASIDLAVIEAPMKYEWRDSNHGLSFVCDALDNCLKPGGFAIVTLGHKAITGTENLISPLKLVHVISLRRTPGQSRSIVGINIAAASIHCLLLYKAPYKSPAGMVVDLHTWSEEDADSILGTLDEVESGIERGFSKFVKSLLPNDGALAHVICSQQNFNMRQHLSDFTSELKASQFVEIG